MIWDQLHADQNAGGQPWAWATSQIPLETFPTLLSPEGPSRSVAAQKVISSCPFRVPGHEGFHGWSSEVSLEFQNLRETDIL